eukprot:CAMPEP_0117439258 /NCGR_PEP_ID=MMETSP0759-20121206/2474_1 /TAXON_ID=63605 /ORGANISM="Percolomonas cosmopolitus, Strain WS" /LENGTH=1351 /DNA_ID=CAMNT_0005230971 /DNA_START=568 /DNA_END=4623 /DNA_ORIENTATION=+
MKELWVWGTIERSTIDEFVNSNNVRNSSAGIPSWDAAVGNNEVSPCEFQLGVHDFNDTAPNDLKHALIALKHHLYSKFSLTYPIYNHFVNIIDNVGFEIDVMMREQRFFVCFEVMEIDFGNQTNRHSTTGNPSSSTRTSAVRHDTSLMDVQNDQFLDEFVMGGISADGAQESVPLWSTSTAARSVKDGGTGVGSSINTTAPRSSRTRSLTDPHTQQQWIITPFGVPAKVVKQNATHVHVKISSMQQQVIAFRREEVRALTHKLPQENNTKILRKIIRLLSLSESQNDILMKQNGDASGSTTSTTNRGSKTRSRKRKRQAFIDKNGGDSHSSGSRMSRAASVSIDGSSFHSSNKSSLRQKKRKTCRDIFESFTVSQHANNNSLSQNKFPPFVNFDITQYEALASFLGTMETPFASEVATSPQTVSIPDFTETQEEQLQALQVYFPHYSGEVPTAVVETATEDAFLVDDTADVKADDLAEDIDDFDKLWDEEEEKEAESIPVEQEPVGPSPAQEQQNMKQMEFKRMLRKRINEFYGDQSKHAADAFAQSMNSDSNMVNDSCTILNPITEQPHDDPLLFPPNPLKASVRDARSTEQTMATNRKIFGIPDVFRSKRTPTNSDNLVFSSSSYIPNFLVDSGNGRYCSMSSFMERMEHSAKHSRHQLKMAESDSNSVATQSDGKAALPSFLDTLSMTESDKKQSDEDDEEEVFVAEPSLLETLYLYLQVLGQGRQSSPTKVLRLLQKTRNIVAQVSQGDEKYTSLLLFGVFEENDVHPPLHSPTSKQQQFNFELIQIHALGQNMSESSKMRCISGEKLAAMLSFISQEVRCGLLQDTFSMRGPLLLEDDVCSISRVSYPGVPLLRLGFTDHWLDTSPEAMNYWEKLLLQPFAPSKRLRYLMITHNGDQDQNRLFANVLRDLSTVFGLCQLGSHTPVREDANIQNGIFQMDVSALVSNHDSVDSLKQFFITAFQRKIRETMLTLKKYISNAAEKDEIIVIYFVNPLPELLTRIILQSLEIPTDEWPVVIHVIDEDKLTSLYDRRPLEELKELAIEVFNKCRSSDKCWIDTDSSYFSRMYEPALVLSPPKDVESPGADSTVSRNETEIRELAIHFAYRIYDFKHVLCTWTDSAGQILESTVLSWNSRWKKEVCQRPQMFLEASPDHVTTSFVVCKYGSQMHEDERDDWKRYLKSEGLQQKFSHIQLVSLELDSPVQLLLDSARLTHHQHVLYPKESFHGSVMVVPSGVSTNSRNHFEQNKSQQECHIFSSLSVNPFESKLSHSINIDTQRFESYVISLHDNVVEDDDSLRRTVKQIGEEMHNMSWLSCSPSCPQRRSILPLHVQLIDSIENILRSHFQQ